MTDVELRTRRAMTVLADQVVPTDMLDRLDRRAAERRPRPPVPRWALVTALAAVAILLALGVVLRSPSPHVIHPVVHPPKVIRLAGAATAAPGRAVMEEKRLGVLDEGAPSGLRLEEAPGPEIEKRDLPFLAGEGAGRRRADDVARTFGGRSWGRGSVPLAHRKLDPAQFDAERQGSGLIGGRATVSGDRGDSGGSHLD